MSMQEDIDWLWALHQDIWPKDRKGKDTEWLALSAHRQLTREELKEVCRIIRERRLITSMFCADHFGGYGMTVYEDPVFPGDKPQRTLTLVDTHIPGNDTWDYIMGRDKPEDPKGGRMSDEAWELFSQFTHSEQNNVWLAMFKLPDSRPRDSYHY